MDFTKQSIIDWKIITHNGVRYVTVKEFKKGWIPLSQMETEKFLKQFLTKLEGLIGVTQGRNQAYFKQRRTYVSRLKEEIRNEYAAR